MNEELKKRAEAISADIKGKVAESYEKRVNQAGIEGNNLPESGVFSGYKIAGEKTADGDFRHIRMTVKGSTDTISLSNLKMIAPKAGEKLVFAQITREGDLKGKYFLRGNAVNPAFVQYSGVELVAFLEGRSFTAKPVDVKQLPFKSDGWDNPSEADTVVRQAWEVKIL